MNISKRILIIILSLIIFSFSIWGQATVTTPSVTTKGTGLSQQQSDDLKQRRQTELLPGQEGALRQLSDTASAEALENESLLKERNKELAANRLGVPREYNEKYGEILKNKKNQLARIAANNCNDGKTVSVQDIEKCKNTPQIWGAGSYYSFRNLTNFNTETGNWADIRFYNDKFIAGSQTVQGIIGNIGEADFDGINLKSPELKFLIEYSPKKLLSEVQEQKKLLESGINANGFIYSNSAALKLNSTYVLRSIAYHLENDEIADNRVNIVVAFKVIGLEKDGSLILLWKELKKDNSPALKG